MSYETLLYSEYISEDFLVDEGNEAERLKQANTKSNEEIEELTIPEDVTDIQRTELLLSDGHNVQKLSAIRYLPRLFREQSFDAPNVILPLLRDVVLCYTPDLQIALSHSIHQTHEDKSLSTEHNVHQVVPLMLSMVASTKEEVQLEWLRIMLHIMKTLPQEVLRKDIMELALQKCDVTQPTVSRLAACRILGALAELLDSKSIVNGFFDKAMNLCQDTDLEIRECMCNQLASIARGVGIEVSKGALLDELFELFRDEESPVRSAAFTCLVSLLDFFDLEVQHKRVIPLIREQYKTKVDDLVDAVAKKFGQFIYTVSANIAIEGDDMNMYLDIFGRFAVHDSPEMRRLYAYAFPAVLQALGAKKYGAKFHEKYVTVANDEEDEVRATVAVGFHEVVKMLPNDVCLAYLKGMFIKFLRDPLLEIRTTIITHMADIFSHFKVENAAERAAGFAEILPAMLDCERGWQDASSWRGQENFLKRCYEAHEYFTSEQIHESFFPLLFNHMQNGAHPLKLAAAKLLCRFLRMNKLGVQRFEVIARLMRDFGRGRSYWNRMLFVDVCKFMVNEFSRQFFKDFFIDQTLEYAQDGVPNVRLKMCQLLPQLKSIIRLPADAPYLERIQNVMALLQTDTDNDVTLAGRKTAELMSKVEVKIASAPKDKGGRALFAETPDDVLDREKEDDENEVLVTFCSEENSDVDDIKKKLIDDILGRSRRAQPFYLSAGQGAKKKLGAKPATVRRTMSDDDLRMKSGVGTTSVGKIQGIAKANAMASRGAVPMASPKSAGTMSKPPTNRPKPTPVPKPATRTMPDKTAATARISRPSASAATKKVVPKK